MSEPPYPVPYGQPYPPHLPPTQPASGLPVPYPTSAQPYPMAPLPPTTLYPAQEIVIAQIGDIQVTSTTVRTPAGQFPLRGCRWTVTDQWVVEQTTPTWAVVLAVVGFFCLTIFSLLFLLAKTSVMRGAVQVQVSNGPYHYVSRIPVANQEYVQYVYQQVNYVRSMSVM